MQVHVCMQNKHVYIFIYTCIQYTYTYVYCQFCREELDSFGFRNLSDLGSKLKPKGSHDKANPKGSSVPYMEAHGASTFTGRARRLQLMTGSSIIPKAWIFTIWALTRLRVVRVPLLKAL